MTNTQTSSRSLLAAFALALAGPACALAAIPPGAEGAPADQIVDFEVFLPLRDKAALESLVQSQQTPGSANYHKWLTPAQFAARFGPSPDAMARGAAALTAAGLEVTATHSRSLHVTTTAGQAAKAFQTTLMSMTDADGSPRIIATRRPTLPATLASQGAVIAAFADRPNHHVHSRVVALPVSEARGATPDNRSSNVGGYYYNDLKQAYDYPAYNALTTAQARLDGAGVRVAVLMDGLAKTSDVTAMFNHEHYATTTGHAAPTLAIVKVGRGGVFSVSTATEPSLDVQQVFGGAPGASVTLFSLSDLSDDHILAGYVAIIENNTYDIVSSSFGECELTYTAAYNGGVDDTAQLRTYHEEFLQGNVQGITFIASSGDNGGLDCPSVAYYTQGRAGTFVAGVETPASDPNVTAVGGGNLVTTTPPSPQTSPPTLTSKYVGENASGDPEKPSDPYDMGADLRGGYWGAGGGRSVVFAAPSYQKSAYTGSTMRTLPDVGMQVGGCPTDLAVTPCGPDRSFVMVWVNGAAQGVIGTSVAAPEFAGAVALYVQNSGGRVGNLNPYLYSKGAAQTAAGGRAAPAAFQFFHTTINGFDGLWRQTEPPGLAYDYLVGNGTADVRKLFGMTGYPAAGNPQTATNP